jgi:Type III secretion needle MxiH, YscF, SsaG, EprI, PscF, EscF
MNPSQVNFDKILDTAGKGMSSREAALMSRVSEPDFGSDIQSLVRTQVDMTLWSVSVSATQGLVKEIGDAMKSVVQKA